MDEDATPAADNDDDEDDDCKDEAPKVVGSDKGGGTATLIIRLLTPLLAAPLPGPGCVKAGDEDGESFQLPRSLAPIL